MTLMVTGGAGVVGSYVVRELVARGDRPVALDARLGDDFIREFDGRVDLCPADIGDLATLIELCQRHEVGVILHLAALTGSTSVDQPMVPFRVNMQGTMHVLEAARLTGVRRVVMASTRTVYPDFEGTPYGHPHYYPVPEDHWLDPRRPYEVWKHAAERMGQFYTERFGLEFAGLRLAIYYSAERALQRGGRAMGQLHAMIGNAVRGLPTVIAGGADKVMDCIYVCDLAHAFVLAADAPALRYPVFNVGGGRPVTPGQFADAVRAAVPGARIKIGSGLEFAPGHYCVLDIDRARRELGFSPQWSLVAGVADCVERTRALLGSSRAG